jgi:thiol-disulfide isomerase/thioredoxin
MTSPQKLKFFSAANKHEQARNENNKLFVVFRVCSRLNLFRVSAILTCVVFLCAGVSDAQTKKAESKTPAPKNQTALSLPKVTQIDAEALKNLLKPNGKPLLINFWATWCDPCREEFPDLVKIGADYKDKIDLITVSLDELSEINGDVPKFLAQMKFDAPAYLLKTPDEGAAIAVVSKSWQGGLPFTILYNANGETVYIKQGKFKTEFLRAEIEKTLAGQSRQIVNLPINICPPVTLMNKKSL